MEEKSRVYSVTKSMEALWERYPRGSIFDRVGVVYRGGDSNIPRV